MGPFRGHRGGIALREWKGVGTRTRWLVAFSLFNEPYHGVHHKYPRLQAAALPQVASVLTPSNPDEVAPFPSYTHALWHMLGTLRDPRIGAQWLPSSKGGEAGPNGNVESPRPAVHAVLSGAGE